MGLTMDNPNTKALLCMKSTITIRCQKTDEDNHFSTYESISYQFIQAAQGVMEIFPSCAPPLFSAILSIDPKTGSDMPEWRVINLPEEKEIKK